MTLWSKTKRSIQGKTRSGAVLMGTVLAGGVFSSVVFSSMPALAQGIPLIRDTEIENLLKDYARPLFRAAGLGGGRVRMRIVRSDIYNAFVVDGRNVFVHTGALTQSDTPNQIIGVIAHETGHISGGHLAALRARIKRDQTRVLLTQILGLGLMVAGAATGGDSGRDIGGAGTGVLYGGQELVMRSLLAERRSQESAADQAGLTYLNRTKQSGRGMLETFERFAQQEYISDQHKDPFVRSHPVATDRLSRLRQLVESSPYYDVKDSAELQLRHDLMRAKLAGYLTSPAAVFNRYPRSDQSFPARYARAIAFYFKGGPRGLDAALRELKYLINATPKNGVKLNKGYFWEVMGDFLMRSGKNAEAIKPLRMALKLIGNESLIQVQLASALQKVGGTANLKQAINLLNKSIQVDKNPRAFRLLAQAYYKQGKLPKADAVTAEAYFHEGNIKQAQIFAKRANQKLKPGSPQWIRNGDIIKYKPRS